MVAGEPVSAQDVQPMTLAMEGAASFISMKNGARHEGFPNGLHGNRGFFASAFDDVSKGARAQRTVKKFGKGFAEALIWHELVAAEVERGGLHVGAVLCGCVDSSGKGGGELFAASLAGALVGAVLGDLKFDRRDVEDLSHFILSRLGGGAFAKVLSAAGAGLVGSEVVDFNVVGAGDFFQGGAWMTFLPSRLFTGFATEALGLRWVRKVALVGGGWFAARAAVALQLGDASFELFQSLNAGPQTENKISNRLGVSLGQSDQFFSGGFLHRCFYGIRNLNLS